jgi:hypothetical protein
VKIILEPADYDPRIYRLTLDFTGYPVDCKWFPLYGKYSQHRNHEVPNKLLDELLVAIKLRRVSGWSVDWDWVRSRRNRRINIYYTMVISDRWNKRNDVG